MTGNTTSIWGFIKCSYQTVINRKLTCIKRISYFAIVTNGLYLLTKQLIMKNTFKLIGAFLILMSVSCKQDNKMTEVIAVHDEVMTEMGTLTKLVGELNSKVDSTETGMKYGNAKKDLQNAHKAMMDWMKGFRDNFDSDEILNGKALTADKQKLLDEEMDKIHEVKKLMESSIQNAEDLLGSEK